MHSDSRLDFWGSGFCRFAMELKQKQNPKTDLGELFESIIFDPEEEIDSSGGATQESIPGITKPITEASINEIEDEEEDDI